MKKNKANNKQHFVKLKKVFYKNKISGFKRVVSLMLVGGIIATCLYSLVYVYDSYAVANMDVSLLYPEISESRYPDNSRFTYYDLISEEKVAEALKLMQDKGFYQHYSADEIAENLHIYPFLDQSAVDAVSYQRSEGNDYSYVANEYRITFVQPHDYGNPNIFAKIFSPDYSETFLETLIDVNKKELTEKYGGFNGFTILSDNGDTSKYDYSELVNVYQSRINSAVNYLNELENASPGFVSKSNGMSVKDVVGEYQLMYNTTLDSISSYVDTAALSKDVQVASNKTKVNIENNNLQYLQYKDESDINNNAQKKYDHTFTENLIVVTINQQSDLYQARPKTAFDDVVTNGLEANNMVKEYGKNLRVLNEELEKLATAETGSEEYQRLSQKCATLIEGFEAEYNRVTELAKVVVQEYNESTNKAFVKSIQVGKELFSTNFVMNAGIVFALGAAILFVLYVAIGVMRDRSKMKGKAKQLRYIRENERSVEK